MNTLPLQKNTFPLLACSMRGKPLVYLDYASTSQKPERVLQVEDTYYRTTNANIHRGVYELSEEATTQYTKAHETVAAFIGAASFEDIVFVRNATEAINTVARIWLEPRLRSGDTILVTAMEHHSNLVPWQECATRRGATLSVVNLTDDGRLDIEDLEQHLAKRPVLFALPHMSNVLGTVNPAQEIVDRAHAHGIPVLLDAAQSVARLPLNVRDLGVDFVAFSGHKMYGPTGIGVLYATPQRFAEMEPLFFGGDMVKSVSETSATWNDRPWKFEAGTPHIAGGIALAEACRFLIETGIENVWKHEEELTAYALTQLQRIPGLHLLGPTTSHLRGGVFSFTLPGLHSHDIASLLDEEGIAVRGGHHCAQPLLARCGLQECTRASVGIPTTREDIDVLVAALNRIVTRFSSSV